MPLPGVVPTSSVLTSLPTTLVSATLGGGGGPAKIWSRCGIFASAPPPFATILFCIANIVRPRVSCRSHRCPQGLRGWCACDYARASILSLHRMLADINRTASSPRTFVPRSGPSPTVVSPPPATTGCKYPFQTFPRSRWTFPRSRRCRIKLTTQGRPGIRPPYRQARWSHRRGGGRVRRSRKPYYQGKDQKEGHVG